MEIQTHVQAMLVGHFHDAVDVFEGTLLDLVHIVRRDALRRIEVDPLRVCHRNANEIEAPVGHPAKIIFAGQVAAVRSRRFGGEIVQQIEPAPAWNCRLSRFGLLRSLCRMARDSHRCTDTRCP